MRELRDEIGQDGFDEVVDVFLEEAGEVIARLCDPCAPVAENLHFLKGSALNLGFSDVAQLCQEGERQLALGQTPDLAGVARAFDQARAALVRTRSGQAA